MTLQLLHSKFPYLWGKFYFIFYQWNNFHCLHALVSIRCAVVFIFFFFWISEFTIYSLSFSLFSLTSLASFLHFYFFYFIFSLSFIFGSISSIYLYISLSGNPSIYLILLISVSLWGNVCVCVGGEGLVGIRRIHMETPGRPETGFSPHQT